MRRDATRRDWLGGLQVRIRIPGWAGYGLVDSMYFVLFSLYVFFCLLFLCCLFVTPCVLLLLHASIDLVFFLRPFVTPCVDRSAGHSVRTK